MKTIITLENVPFEGFENANFIATLNQTFQEFNIPRENIQWETELEHNEMSIGELDKVDNILHLNEFLHCAYAELGRNENITIERVRVLQKDIEKWEKELKQYEKGR